jgi:hypothetical protein
MGVPGTDGAPGTDGTPGTPGTEGPAGKDALSVVGGAAPAVIPVNDGKTTAGDIEIGDAPPAMDPRDYFVGGTGPFVYKVMRIVGTQDPPEPDPEEATDTFAASIPTEGANEGMLVISIKKGVTAPADGSNTDDDYTVGSRFTLSVTDANKVTVEKMLYVLANRAPGASEEDTAAFTLRVGTQNAEDAVRKAAGQNPKCATFDVCAATPSVSADSTSETVQFTDDLAADAAGAAIAGASPALTFEVVRVSQDADAVSVTTDGKAIMVTGKVATNNGNAKDDDDPVTLIVVRAVDSNGMYTDRDLTVTVDGRPTVKTMLQSKYTIPQFSQGTTKGILTINNIASFFSDVESGIEIHDVDSDASDTQVMTADSNIATAVVSGDNLVVTAENIGTTTVTVRAVESDETNQQDGLVVGLGQWVEQSFTVEVE